MLRRLLAAWVAALVVIGGFVPAAAASTPPDEIQGPRLEWTDCGDAECAVLPVPLDDRLVGGPTIDLALIRYRARDREHRIGSLLVNPGGPGASGVDYVSAAASSLPPEILDRFDIVGFDPRGVGQSNGVDCTDDLDPLYDAEFAPDDDAERAELEAAVQALVTQCAQRDGAILPYLTTERAARDLDRIREALGDDQLTYLGYSYGTYLGAWYAEQFPDRVRALVLDGAVDPALDATAVQIEQSKGFERALRLFLRDCAGDERCPFHNDGAPGKAYDRLRARIGETPLAGADGRELNGTLFDIGVTQALYAGRSSWSSLANVLAAAADGDPAGLIELADLYTGRNDDGSYGDMTEAFFAIGCADGPAVGGLEGLRAIEYRVQRAAPRLGRSIVNNSMACAFWPVAPAAPAPLPASGAAPILVLGTRDDPATPLAWAQGLARELDSGVLMTVGGERHTAFGGGNACIDGAVVRYLVDGTVPKPGTRC